MASSSIKIALEMTGVQAYANATERAAQANEKLAEGIRIFARDLTQLRELVSKKMDAAG